MAREDDGHVEIRIPTMLRRYCDGQAVAVVSAATVGEAVQAISAMFPALQAVLGDGQGNLQPYVRLYLNDTDVTLTPSAKTHAGAPLIIVTAVPGG